MPLLLRSDVGERGLSLCPSGEDICILYQMPGFDAQFQLLIPASWKTAGDGPSDRVPATHLRDLDKDPSNE